MDVPALDAVHAVRVEKARLAVPAKDSAERAPVQQPLAAVVAGAVEGRVASERAGEDPEEGEPPAEDPRMREDAGRDDWDFLGHRQAEPGGEDDEEQPDVTQLLDEARDHLAPRTSGRSASCALRTVYTPERRMQSPVRCEPSFLEWSSSHGSQTLRRRPFVLDLH